MLMTTQAIAYGHLCLFFEALVAHYLYSWEKVYSFGVLSKLFSIASLRIPEVENIVDYWNLEFVSEAFPLMSFPIVCVFRLVWNSLCDKLFIAENSWWLRGNYRRKMFWLWHLDNRFLYSKQSESFLSLKDRHLLWVTIGDKQSCMQ